VASCVFCRIAAGEIPATFLYADGEIVAFADLNPQAPFHALVIPRAHVAKLSDLMDEGLGGRLLRVAQKVAADAGHGGSFRMVVNNGEGAGQTVAHLHFHVLGGRPFAWPPG